MEICGKGMLVLCMGVQRRGTRRLWFSILDVFGDMENVSLLVSHLETKGRKGFALVEWMKLTYVVIDDLRTLDKQQRDAYLRRRPAMYPEEDFEARVMLYHLYVFFASDCARVDLF
jgi:hypothetical protein